MRIMSDLVADLDKVKKDLRSLLISAPKGLTSLQLEKDYKEIVGHQLPYRKFGYFNCLEFLRNLNDIVYISTNNGKTLFFGVADEKTRHIYNMVQKQKNSKPYSKIYAQQRRPAPQKMFSSTVPNSSAYLRSGILKVIKKYPDGFPISRLPHLYQEVNDTSLDDTKVQSISSLIMQMPDIATMEFGRKDLTGNKLYVYPSKKLEIYKNLLKSKLKLADTNKLVRNHNESSTGLTPCPASNAVVASCAIVSSTFTSKVTQSTQITSEKRLQSCSIVNDRNIAKASSQNDNRFYKSVPKFCKSKNYASENAKKCLRSKASSTSDDSVFKLTSAFEPITPPSLALLQQEVIELLRECPNGICSIEIPGRFEEKFHKELDLHMHGYYSIVEFLVSMTSQVQMCRLSKTGDWLVKLRKNISSSSGSGESCKQSSDLKVDLAKVKQDIKELVKKYKGGFVIKSLEDIYEMNFGQQLPVQELGFHSVTELICMITDKLDLIDGDLCLRPSSAVKPANFPSQSAPVDAVGRGICYNSPNTPLKEWGFFDCFISHIENPGQFYIQVIGFETTEALDELMNELEKFYNHPRAKAYKMPTDMVRKGQVGVALYQGDNNWNRIVTNSDPQAGFVDVIYVDYGDVASVSVGSLYLLKSKFLVLPALMVRCRLAHVLPPDLENWDCRAKRVMLDICRNKPMVAEVVGTDDNNVISLLLCDTSKDDVDVYLNDVLLEKNLATFVADETSKEQLEELRQSMERERKVSSSSTAMMLPQEAPPPYEEQDTLSAITSTQNTGYGQPNQEIQKTFTSGGASGSSVKASCSTEKILVDIRHRLLPQDLNKVLSTKDSPGKSVEHKTAQTCDQGTKEVSNNTPSEITSPPLPSSKQQKRFLKPYLIHDNSLVHVVNYEGNGLLISGEISSLYRPKEGDFFKSMLLLKGLHFPEFLLENNETNTKLFQEFKSRKVKGFLSEDNMKRTVTLYRLSDISSIVNCLEHKNKTTLKKQFEEMVLSFHPDSQYWFSDDAICPVNLCDMNSSENPLSWENTSSFTDRIHNLLASSQARISKPSNRVNGEKKQTVAERKQELVKKKEEIKKELVKTQRVLSDSSIMDDLESVIRQINKLENNSDDDDVLDETLKNNSDAEFSDFTSNDICAIPSDDNNHSSTLTSIFSTSNVL